MIDQLENLKKEVYEKHKANLHTIKLCKRDYEANRDFFDNLSYKITIVREYGVEKTAVLLFAKGYRCFLKLNFNR